MSNTASYTFEREDIIQIKNIFSIFAAGSKTQIPLKDVPSVFKRVGLHRTESEMKKLLLPFEGFEGLEFPHFLSLLTRDITIQENPKKFVRYMSEFTEQAKEAFVSMDKDGNGTLSPNELKEGMEQMMGDDVGQIDIDAMFTVADSNKDGELDFSEFRSALKAAKSPFPFPDTF